MLLHTLELSQHLLGTRLATNRVSNWLSICDVKPRVGVIKVTPACLHPWIEMHRDLWIPNKDVNLALYAGVNTPV